jgi:hypothetical protein
MNEAKVGDLLVRIARTLQAARLQIDVLRGALDSGADLGDAQTLAALDEEMAKAREIVESGALEAARGSHNP